MADNFNWAEKKPPKNYGKTINREVDNTKYMQMTMELMALKPLDLKYCRAEAIQERYFEYFNICNEFDIRPTAAGLAQALGCGRDTLLNYISGKVVIPLDSQNELRKAYGMINTLMESYMIENKVNPVSGIFLMKNNFNYKDCTEVVAVDNKDGTMTPEALIEESNLMLSGDTKKASLEVNEVPKFEIGESLVEGVEIND